MLPLPQINNQYNNRLILTPYKSPTLYHDPMKEYGDKQIQETINRMMIDQIKNELNQP